LGAIPRFDQRQLSRHTAQEFSGHDVNAVLIENFQKCIATRFWALLQFENRERLASARQQRGDEVPVVDHKATAQAPATQ
jgi:hypothetical protein